MIEHFLESLGLKAETRTGWVLRGIAGAESVADHSWGTAYLCLLYAGTEHVDASRAVTMAVVHDLAEAKTGDIATRIALMSDPTVAAEKARRETVAMDELLRLADPAAAATVRELWDEYERANTGLGLFVRDMNLIDMCAQAYIYERDGGYEPESPHFPDYQGMDEFFATTRPRLCTDTGRRLYGELADLYAALPSVVARGGPRGVTG